jgi:predicted membrane channel-forming protein YqfA (hemolysin III family)
MEIFFWIVLVLPFFIWPIFHAIFGNTRKTKILRIIFFLLVATSLIATGITLVDLMSDQYEKGELFAGLTTILTFLAVGSLIFSFGTILFIREGK